MWFTFLRTPMAYARPFMDFSKKYNAVEIDMFSDASKNSKLGCGGYCQNEWFMTPWDPQFIQTYDPSIAYLELYALTVGVVNWIHKFRNKRVVLFCDNQSVVWMVNSTTAHSKRCMILIRIIVLQSLMNNVRIFAKYVRSKDNILSDSLSRNRLDLFWKRCKFLSKEMNALRTPIPEQLWPMTKVWFI